MAVYQSTTAFFSKPVPKKENDESGIPQEEGVFAKAGYKGSLTLTMNQIATAVAKS